MDKKIFNNTDKGLILNIKIIPNSKKFDIVFEENFLKIKVTALPIENKANKALVEYLAKKLHCAKSKIQIIKGELNKEKTLLIEDFTEEKFIEKISLK